VRLSRDELALIAEALLGAAHDVTADTRAFGT